ncbi:hypothetical protein EI546_14980 [Aequorivita sp. H23M31]|uniref:Uncharacterized protein n=1 Tax=Aequorivita ciconiae TaxID=2494375 RepID=A0A410G6U6_9FLAO|nr:hypothetical protein [Aequorivita sp. H23M31]QAA82941.1 hypothetical protein EI546_14980 [Aequorivita sp. H23M31]
MILQLKSGTNGQIKVTDNTIYIDDVSGRMHKYGFKAAPFLFLLFGVYQIYSGIIAVNDVQTALKIFSGMLLIAIPALLYHSNFIRTNRKEIEFNEIRYVKMKSILGGIFVDFKLNDNSTRRVYNIKNRSEWNLIKNILQENSVLCFG